MPLKPYPFAPNLTLENYTRLKHHWWAGGEKSYFYAIGMFLNLTPLPSFIALMAKVRLHMNMSTLALSAVSSRQ